MDTQYKKTVLFLAIALAIAPLTAFSRTPDEKQFGKDAPFNMTDLPLGHVRSKLERLKPAQQQRAMNWLHSFSFTAHDLPYLQIDNAGGVFYSDTVLPKAKVIASSTTSTSTTTTTSTGISATNVFKLHSRPGATNIIYLDFDGQTISSTAWNSSLNITTLYAKPFDTDGAPSSFGATEINQIAEIWHRVAEDYSPFNVDVTTELPASFGSTVGRVLITQDIDSNGNKMPSYGAGGIAYVNVWGMKNYASYYSPALVYYNNLSSNAPYIAEAAAHEMGHNLSLAHDGYNDGTTSLDYYNGLGSGLVSWAPIMGASYYNNVSQWSKGEYPYATQLQDDVAEISNRLKYRADDVGNDMFSATSLVVDSTGVISTTTPETDPQNANKSNKGIIGVRGDVDFFAFDSAAGTINLTVKPAWAAFYRSSSRGGNLDIQATLYNSSGAALVISNPQDDTSAVISTAVSAGHYFLAVTGVANSVTPYSDYDSLGEYFISGTVVPGAVLDTTAPAPNPMTWAVLPNAGTNSNSISMQATTATDASGSVQYHFVCTTGGSGCVDAGWQTSSQYTATGLQSGVTYSYQVQARDVVGNLTSFSPIASATTTGSTATMPVAPSNLTGSKTTTLVSLQWSSVSNATSYNIWRCAEVKKGTKISCSYGSTRYAISASNTYSTAASSTIYHYKVTASNSQGTSGFSNEIKL